LTAAVMAAGLALAAPAMAQARFEPLGIVVYDARPVKTVIEVPRKAGGYVALRMDVTGSDVEVLDLKVMYGNGTVDDISVRQVFKAGTSSRVIDLKGGNRQIDKIGVTYVPRGPARIAFLGVPGAAPNWDTLGCKDVGFVVDRDVIKVGRKDGTFKALKLRVKQAPIEIFNLRVVYGNGAKQDINVKAVVKPGTETRPLDLAGKERGIDRVEMIYRSIPSFKGKATVCVDGLQ